MSFGFCFTKSLDEGDKEADVSSSTWLVMTDSHSGYLGRCPLRHTRSWLSPRASGIQQCAFLLTMSPRLINARHAMGLPTRISTSKIADHSNALAENAVNRIRGLA